MRNQFLHLAVPVRVEGRCLRAGAAKPLPAVDGPATGAAVAAMRLVDAAVANARLPDGGLGDWRALEAAGTG